MVSWLNNTLHFYIKHSEANHHLFNQILILKHGDVVYLTYIHMTHRCIMYCTIFSIYSNFDHCLFSAGNASLFSSVRNANLSDGEVQTLIDILFEKQGGGPSVAMESWNKVEF